jgi:hypothetical protein
MPSAYGKRRKQFRFKPTCAAQRDNASRWASLYSPTYATMAHRRKDENSERVEEAAAWLRPAEV